MQRLTENKKQILTGFGPEPMNGNEVRKAIGGKAGSFYPALRALVDDGLLTRDLGLHEGRPAWMYQLTPVGQRLAEALDAGLVNFPADWQAILNDNEGET